MTKMHSIVIIDNSAGVHDLLRGTSTLERCEGVGLYHERRPALDLLDLTMTENNRQSLIRSQVASHGIHC